MITLSTYIKSKIVDLIVRSIDVGSENANGYIEVRTAPRPATSDLPATGILLATLNYSLPAFGDVINTMAVANSIEAATIITNGPPAWCRVFDRDGNVIFDGDCDTDFEFNSTYFVLNGICSLDQQTFNL